VEDRKENPKRERERESQCVGISLPSLTPYTERRPASVVCAAPPTGE
jgi:hypothetical protein